MLNIKKENNIFKLFILMKIKVKSDFKYILFY
jgi:hypothetical protein